MVWVLKVDRPDAKWLPLPLPTTTTASYACLSLRLLCRFNATLTNVLAKRLADRLDAVLTALAYCKGSACRFPWHVLHPNGQVRGVWGRVGVGG